MSTNPNILALHNKEVTASPSSKGNDDNSYLDSNNPLFIMMMLYSKIIKQSAVSQWTQALIDESKQQDLNAIQNKLDDLLSQLKNITDESNSLIDKFKKMPLWEKIAIITAVVVVAVVAVAAMAGVASMMAASAAEGASAAAAAAGTAAEGAATAAGTAAEAAEAAATATTEEAATAASATASEAATTASAQAETAAAQASQAASKVTMLQASGASTETVEAANASAEAAQASANAAKASAEAAQASAQAAANSAEGAGGQAAAVGDVSAANTTVQASNMAKVAGYVGNGVSRILISPVALPAGAGYLTYQLLPGGDWHQESYTVYNSDGKKENVTGTQNQANEALQKEQTYVSTEMSNASQEQDTTNAGMKKDSSFIDNQESLQNASSENIQKAILTYKDIYVVHAV